MNEFFQKSSFYKHFSCPSGAPLQGLQGPPPGGALLGQASNARQGRPRAAAASEALGLVSAGFRLDFTRISLGFDSAWFRLDFGWIPAGFLLWFDLDLA